MAKTYLTRLTEEEREEKLRAEAKKLLDNGIDEIKARVQHLVIFGKLVITNKILKITTEHINFICSLEFRLSFDYLSHVGILATFEVIE